MEYLGASKSDWPTSYYGPHSGVAMALNALEQPNRRIAVVGLGTGTLAAWGRAGDSIRFYEINPDVEPIARSWFRFLHDSHARTEVVLGDARVQLGRELAAGQSQDFDLIAVDAFSGDSIPMHLLTAECADIYRRRLKPGGVLALLAGLSRIGDGLIDPPLQMLRMLPVLALVPMFIIWLGIAVCHLRFRKAWVAQGRSPDELKFKSKFYPYGPWLALVLFLVVLFGANINVFQTPVFSWFDFITDYLMIPVFVILYLSHKFWHNTRVVPLRECNFEVD